MLAASVILPQEQKTFHLVLLKHLSVDLKIELFLLQLIWFYFLLKSTSSFPEFYTVETRMYSSGGHSRNGRLGPLVKLAWFHVSKLNSKTKKLQRNHPDVMSGR